MDSAVLYLFSGLFIVSSKLEIPSWPRHATFEKQSMANQIKNSLRVIDTQQPGRQEAAATRPRPSQQAGSYVWIYIQRVRSNSLGALFHLRGLSFNLMYE